MATVSPGSIVAQSKGVYRVTWEGLGTGSADDVGAAVIVPGGYADVTIQVIGTFAGSTLTMEGSVNGSAWAALTADPSGSAAFAAAGVKRLSEKPFSIRPVLTCGSSSDLDVIVLIRKQ